MSKYDFIDNINREEQIKNIRLAEYQAYMEEIKDGYLSLHPDKYGCYSKFVRDFATDDLLDDFPHIMHEFLKVEFGNIDKYTEISYWQMVRGTIAPHIELFCQSKNIMFSAYKQGNIFAKKCWINIFREYFEVYNRKLAGKKSVDFKYLHSMIKDIESDDEYFIEMAGLLTMSEIMGIEINEDCSYAYYALNQVNDKNVDLSNNVASEYELSKESISKACEWVDKLANENPIPENWYDTKKRGYRPLRYSNEIAQLIMQMNRFGSYYPTVANYEKCLSPMTSLVYTKALLIENHPNVEYKDSEIMSMAPVAMVTDSFAEAILQTFHYMDIMFGMDEVVAEGTDRNYYKSSLKNGIIPEIKTDNNENKKSTEEEEHVLINVDTKLESAEIHKELLQEIERLRLVIHKKDSQYEYLKRLYNEKESSKKQFDNLNEQYQTEHIELVELRRHLYMLSEEDIESQACDLQEMVNKLQDYKVTVIGGHSNWTQKLKSILPGWTFIKPQVSDVINEKNILNVDFVYFFTDFLSHSTYYRYMNFIRKNNLKFGYVHSVNPEANIIQFCRDLL